MSYVLHRRNTDGHFLEIDYSSVIHALVIRPGFGKEEVKFHCSHSLELKTSLVQLFNLSQSPPVPFNLSVCDFSLSSSWVVFFDVIQALLDKVVHLKQSSPKRKKNITLGWHGMATQQS